MTSLPRFERNLPALLEDLYLGPLPDYRDDLLAGARRTRQRPAWSFPERWLPVDIATRFNTAPRYPVRAIGMTLLVLALISAALIAYVGTHQTRIPAPFGPARNGAYVYAVDGDIYSADPITGTTRALTTGTGIDRKPTVSPDGTRLAFLRGKDTTGDAFDLVVANVDGTDARVVSTATVSDGDPLQWSPDGTFILLTNVAGDLVRYDAVGAAPVVIAHQALIHGFQPPSGRHVLYEPFSNGDRSLGLMDPDGSNASLMYTIPAAQTKDGCDYGTVAWSPDGTRIAFQRAPAGESAQCRIFVMNADGSDAHQLTTNTGIWFETDFRWSPDSTRIAFDRWEGSGSKIQPLGLVSAAGGLAQSLGPTPVSDGAAFEWAPDGKTIVSVPGTVLAWPPNDAMATARPTIIDVATGQAHEATWSVNSWPSYQRLAP
jgi:Tol biopolymer transport system component